MTPKLAYLLVLAALWGPSFLFIRVVVHAVPPLTMVACRILSATAMLYLPIPPRGRPLPRHWCMKIAEPRPLTA